VKKVRVVSTVIEMIAFGVFIMFSVLFINFYSILPDKIPVRTGIEQLLGMGGKVEFVIIFWIAFLMYGILFVLKRFPKLMAYPVKTHAYNIETQVNLAKLMLSLLTLFSASLFLCILYDMYSFASYLKAAMPEAVIFGLAGAMPLTLIAYILIARKFK